MKQDVDEGTIYGYEGEFEIVELIPGIYEKAVFRINGEEIRLKYYEDEDYEAVKPGVYTGKLIYGKHTATVIDMEIYPTDEE